MNGQSVAMNRIDLGLKAKRNGHYSATFGCLPEFLEGWMEALHRDFKSHSGKYYLPTFHQQSAQMIPHLCIPLQVKKQKLTFGYLLRMLVQKQSGNFILGSIQSHNESFASMV